MCRITGKKGSNDASPAGSRQLVTAQNPLERKRANAILGNRRPLAQNTGQHLTAFLASNLHVAMHSCTSLTPPFRGLHGCAPPFLTPATWSPRRRFLPPSTLQPKGFARPAPPPCGGRRASAQRFRYARSGDTTCCFLALKTQEVGGLITPVVGNSNRGAFRGGAAKVSSTLKWSTGEKGKAFA